MEFNAINYQERLDYFNKLKLQQSCPEPFDIDIELKDKTVIKCQSWVTCPMDLAKNIFKNNASKYIVAKVNNELYDMNRPLENNCQIEFLTFDDEEAKSVFWHSSAHLLGECCECLYCCHLEHGPPTKDGFFYDMYVEEKLSETNFSDMNKTITKFSEEKQNFERLVVSKNDLLILFKDNPMKLHFINEKISEGASSTVYRCGNMVDLCLGPHIPHSGLIKSFECTKTSSSYWLGNAKNQSLTRIYGISFPEKKMMSEWKKQKEEAAARDHRVIGKNQKLFFFHEYSPGSCFFLPHGTKIYNTLVNFIKEQYHQRGYTEVMTPNMSNAELWKKSGHWEHYKENMFALEVNKTEFALKAMNCPLHCVMFNHTNRSYKELPLRFADFGVLHRNELHGALTGLTRVIRFSQDDKHVFCREDQLEVEISHCLDFIKYVYGVLGLTFSLGLSTRPENYIGDLDIWNKSEEHLTKSLNNSGFEWKLNPGDGAFYGPKIDIEIEDATKKHHQCATIQLDFNLPERFELKYQTSDSIYSRPIIIHNAILGSVERMFAILCEHYAGKWPFWLSPRQICIIPIDSKYNDYANEVFKIYHNANFNVEIDNSTDKLNKKIRNAQVEQFNFIFVVGQKEMETNTVNVRNRESQILGTLDHAFLLNNLSKLKNQFIQVNNFN